MSRTQLLKSLSFSQGMILLYSSILTVFPQYYQYVIILVFATFLAYSIYASAKRISATTRGSDADYVKSGRVIVKAQPNKIIELMNRDERLIQDMKPQMRLMASSLIGLPLIFIIYYPYLDFVMPIFRSSNNILLVYIGYLILFELLFMTPWIINRFFIMRGDIRIVQPLRDYVITSRGIQAPGLLVKFPLDSSYRVYCSRKRRFVDIEISPQTQSLTGVKMIPVYRLYMPESDLVRVIEILERYGGSSVSCE
ncbi:MAG: DUF2208 family protein [Sulfolobales archaeon]